MIMMRQGSRELVSEAERTQFPLPEDIVAYLVRHLRTRAGCPPECVWRAGWVPHRSVWQARHNGGEAIGLVDPPNPDDLTIQPWLAGLHPEVSA